MADEHDALSFLDSGSMSQQERDALALTTGGESPTTQAETTTETAGQASVGTTPAAKVEVEQFEDDGTGHRVPLTALLNEREKRQRLEGELATLRTTQETQEADGALTFDFPDPNRDPAGYARAQAGFQNLQLLNERMNFSERFARMKHTDDVVQAAHDWAITRFKADPSYEERIMHEADPYEAIVKDHKVQTRGEEVKDDDWTAFQAWKAQQAAEAGQGDGSQIAQQPAAQAQAGAAPQQQARRMPAASIADMPGAGGSPHAVPVGAGQAFDNVFK